MEEQSQDNKCHNSKEAAANNYLKRGKGKLSGNVKKQEFYNYYLKNAKHKIVDRPTYNGFIRELLEAYSTSVVTTGLELRIHKVGKLRVRSQKLRFTNKEGVISKSLKPNWKATWDYWLKKYPGLTRDEIVNTKNKPVLYHENDHSQQEFYEHFWDKITIALKYKSFYDFKAPRQYSRLIAKVVKDPNRKTFYYG